ncbi:Guanine nucleotide exchange factor [Fasciola hepatica]|uniref:Guanine nucleotide exchange factor n=1 Tax=Fasciola hepatica TaxID=6192 RepID=A0A4E0RXI7_FASHE|nr:Guanine nucleotide exchange factor [Fasciola hepatica]
MSGFAKTADESKPYGEEGKSAISESSSNSVAPTSAQISTEFPHLDTEQEDDEEEEILTTSHPPTELVDTVVTMTKNPDGSLKKTTRKTTRTLVTTTRVRRIRAKPPIGERLVAVGDNDGGNVAPMSTSPEQSGMSDASAEQQQSGKLYTLVGPKQLSQDDGENRITQATFTIMTPTSRTEVTYHEDDQPVSSMDPETLKHLQSMREEKLKQNCAKGIQGSGETDALDITSPELQHARTKTTVRKTVIASAAKATLVATGTSKPPKNALLTLNESANQDPEKSVKFDPSQFHQDILTQVDLTAPMTTGSADTCETKDTNGGAALSTSGPMSTDNMRSTGAVTNATVTTKRNTRTGNNLVNKSLLFSKASLESLKKPFALWSKDLKQDALPIGDEALSTVETIKLDGEDTDQLALLAMKESERLFSEAKYFVSGNPRKVTTTTTTIVHPTNNEMNEVKDSRFQSRFSNLPLYQGYGLIGQQLQLSSYKKEPESLMDQQNEENADTDVVCRVDTFEDSSADAAMSDWSAMLMNLTNTTAGSITGLDPAVQSAGCEVSTVTTDLLSLLDATTDRLLQEATKQWCTLGYTPLGIPSSTPPPMPNSEANRTGSLTGSLPEDKNFEAMMKEKIREHKKSITSHHSIESLLPETTTRANLPKEDYHHRASFHRESLTLNERTAIKSPTDAQEEHHIRAAESPPRLSGLGVTRPGAFRVAWSDMTEVLSSGILKLLTKHEIQLQEAMFEVITSEASYYQSLNVLVNHFYHSPEFSCETNNAAHVSSPSMTRAGVSNLAGTGSAIRDGGSGIASRGQSSVVGSPTHGTGLLQTGTTLHLELGPDSSPSSLSPSSPSTAVKRSVLKPLEKHHLFSNVLLVCLASEKFLRDLEARWALQTPVVSEVCDLIVKHAGGANFEPYITYLRNQAYQLDTLRNLCQRDSFRSALETLHGNPICGKNSLSSFLALPMQRLTRLKLLVEVIRRLQDAVIRDAAEAENGKRTRPYRIPTDRERENVQLALCELSRLLASSETEKELMDQKARLLTLSTSLEFMDTVKSIAISDKRLIKEGELREVSADGRVSMLQKLSLKKPNAYYFILFNDLLLITKRKKNDRYLVLDYCERAEIQAEVQRLGDPSTPRPSKPTAADDSKLFAAIVSSSGSRTPNEKLRTRSGSPIHTYAVRPRRPKTTMDFPRVTVTQQRVEGNSGGGTGPGTKFRPSGLARSGSSLSSYHIDQHVKLSPFSRSPPTEQPKVEALHLVLTASQNAPFTEMTLLPKDIDDFLSWCKALGISSTPAINPSLDRLNGTSGSGIPRRTSNELARKEKTDF